MSTGHKMNDIYQLPGHLFCLQIPYGKNIFRIVVNGKITHLRRISFSNVRISKKVVYLKVKIFENSF